MCAGELEAPDETLIGALIKHEVVRRVTQVLLGLKTYPVSISESSPSKPPLPTRCPKRGALLQERHRSVKGPRVPLCFRAGHENACRARSVSSTLLMRSRQSD